MSIRNPTRSLRKKMVRLRNSDQWSSVLIEEVSLVSVTNGEVTKIVERPNAPIWFRIKCTCRGIVEYPVDIITDGEKYYRLDARLLYTSGLTHPPARRIIKDAIKRWLAGTTGPIAYNGSSPYMGTLLVDKITLKVLRTK